MEGNSMTFEEIRKQWQSEVAQPAAVTDPKQLLAGVQRRFGTLERTIFWRDVREFLAGLVGICAFAAFWPIYRTSLVASVGVAIILLSTPMILYKLLAASRSRTTHFTSSVLDFSRDRLAWLDRQIRLLQTVAWWYVAPLGTGCMLVAWGLTPGRWFAFVQVAALNVGVAVITVWLNHRSVRINLLPARQELLELIESLESPAAA
jgi:hypothetical protein